MLKKFALSFLVMGSLSACISNELNTVNSSRVSASDSIETNIQYALENTESGDYHYWGSGSLDGRVMPTKTFRTADGTYCREYTSQTRVSGNVNSTKGILCRDNAIDRWVSRK